MPKEAADVYYHLGLAQLELGNNQEALTAFNQAIGIKAKNPEVRLYIHQTFFFFPRNFPLHSITLVKSISKF